jgi:hypothetical protein
VFLFDLLYARHKSIKEQRGVYPMINTRQQNPESQLPFYPGFEYRSELEFLGWPLVHITKGYDPQTGKQLVSKGLIAIGEIAIGGVAVGGLAVGGIAVGGMGLGVFALGGLAIGGFAAGGIALGLAAAIGGVVYSLMYAIGGLAYAPYVISPFRVDREILNLLGRFWSGIQHIF